MRLFLIFFLLFSSSLKAEEVDNDYAEFFQIKHDIKELMMTVVKTEYTSTINKNIEVKITGKLKDGLNNLILKGNQFLYTLISDYDEIEDDMMFTVLARYKDVVWEFHIFCQPDTVMFFSRLADAPPTSFEEYYNWLNFEKG